MSKTTKFLDINLDGVHIVGIRINDRKQFNPFRVYRVCPGHRRMIAKYGDFMSVIYYIRDLYLDGADTLTLPELIDWSKKHGCI